MNCREASTHVAVKGEAADSENLADLDYYVAGKEGLYFSVSIKQSVLRCLNLERSVATGIPSSNGSFLEVGAPYEEQGHQYRDAAE